MAKGFRDISGATFKTPESLCWLIKRRQWTDERIRRIGLGSPAAAELTVLQEQLAAIDVALGLHKTQIDRGLLRPVRKKADPWRRTAP